MTGKPVLLIPSSSPSSRAVSRELCLCIMIKLDGELYKAGGLVNSDKKWYSLMLMKRASVQDRVKKIYKDGSHHSDHLCELSSIWGGGCLDHIAVTNLLISLTPPLMMQVFRLICVLITVQISL